jgi:hypothetical protein
VKGNRTGPAAANAMTFPSWDPNNAQTGGIDGESEDAHVLLVAESEKVLRRGEDIV